MRSKSRASGGIKFGQAVNRARVALAQALERRTLFSTGVVSGIVYSDYYGTGTNLSGDPGQTGQTVYADLNNSGSYSAADPSTTTDANGNYVLSGVPQGPAILRIALQGVDQGSQRESYPSYGGGEHVTVGSLPVANVDFAVTKSDYASGSVFVDLNGDGKRESNEPGLANVDVYESDAFAVGSGPSAVTASDGSFALTGLGLGAQLNLGPLPAGYRQTLPADNAGIGLPYQAGLVDQGLSFGLTPIQSAVLTGAVAASAGSTSGTTGAKAFDGNLSTFFDATTASGGYAGLDFGSAKIINQLAFAPRSGYANRMGGGVFEASNSPTFSSGVVTLYTITSTPAAGKLTTVPVATYSDYQYVRYVGPTGGYCDVAEIQFLGLNPAGSAFVQSGILHINGTVGADTIRVTVRDGDQSANNALIIATTVNGVQQIFNPKTLNSIVLNTYGGNDSISVNLYTSTDVALLPVSITAGDGNDTFNTEIDAEYGGGANENEPLTVTAGNGNDLFQLNGTDVSSTVVAGNGNDGFFTAIDGGGGLTSVITAGNGNDTLGTGSSGASGQQRVNFTAGIGQDQVINGDSDDYVSGTIAGEGFSLGWQQEILLGNVYSDTNGDGKFEAGESLVVNAPVSFENSYAGAFGATTDSTGGYGVQVPVNTDGAPPQTFGGPFPIELSPGMLLSGVDIAMRPKLNGSVIGTAGSYKNAGNTIAKAFDGNLSTYFDAPAANGNYAGLNLGSQTIITGITVAPRSGWAGRMVGGVFQASNSPTFASAVNLYTISSTPITGVLTYEPIGISQPYQYVRYVGPAGSFGDAAELQFFTTKPAAAGSVLGGDGLLTVTGTSGSDNIHLTVNFPASGTQTITTIVNNIAQTFNAQLLKGIVINTGDGNDTVTVDGSYAITYGVAGVNPTTDLAAVINAGNGNDIINASVYGSSQADGGNSPSDTINLGSGSDSVTVNQDGSSVVNCGAGNDTVMGIAPDSSYLYINGGSGDDVIYGAHNVLPFIYGGTGINTYYAGPPLFGGTRAEYILGSTNFNVQNLIDNNSNESITVMGSNAPDRIQITGTGNNVTVHGGNANDLIHVANAATADIVTGNGSNSVYISATGSATVTGGSGNDTIDAADSPGPVTINGGAGVNTAFTQPYDIVTDIQFLNPQTGKVLTGTLLATAGSYQGDGNTAANAFDGNLSTFFDGPTRNGDFAGLDLGSYQRIESIAFAPRPGWESRMAGGVFESSDSPTFSNPTILYTVSTAPPAGQLTTIRLTHVTYARYIRYLAPDGSFGDVAEIQIRG